MINRNTNLISFKNYNVIKIFKVNILVFFKKYVVIIRFKNRIHKLNSNN